MSPTYQELRKISENIPSKLANSFAHKDTNYQSDYSPYNLSSRVRTILLLKKKNINI